MSNPPGPRGLLSPAPWHAALAIPVLYLFGYLVDRAYYGRIQMENPGLQPGQHMVVGVQFVAFTAFPVLIVLLALWGYAAALGAAGHSNADHGLRRIWRHLDTRRAARRVRARTGSPTPPRRTLLLAARVRLGRMVRSGRFRTGVHSRVLLVGRVGLAACLAGLGVVFWMVILDFSGVGRDSSVGRGYGSIIASLTLLAVYLRPAPSPPSARLVVAPVTRVPSPEVRPSAHILWLGPLVIVFLPVLTAIYGGSLYPSIVGGRVGRGTRRGGDLCNRPRGLDHGARLPLTIENDDLPQGFLGGREESSGWGRRREVATLHQSLSPHGRVGSCRPVAMTIR